jgi:hypothetical protein
MRKDRGAFPKETGFTNGIVSPISCADDQDEEEEEEDERNKDEEEEEEEEEEPAYRVRSRGVPRPAFEGSTMY